MRSAADYPLRAKLKQLGARFITETIVKEWHGDGATLMSLLDSGEERIACDALVLATPNVSETTLSDELSSRGVEVRTLGDCVAPRWAVHAIYEGRKLGRSL